MSAQDRDRLKVLHAVSRRHIAQMQAARELGIRSRWVRALLGRIKVDGEGGVGHRPRGQPSNRKAPEDAEAASGGTVSKQKRARLWHDYGPRLAAEELARATSGWSAGRHCGTG